MKIARGVKMIGAIVALLLLTSLPQFQTQAQYVAPYVAVTGTLSSSNGMPAQNYVISFAPTQLFFVGGTSVVVSGSTCGTDVSGSVVGVRNPLTGAVVAVQYSGTLPAANYYVAVSWYDTYAHQTLVSPVVTAQLTSAGSLLISPPSAGAPANALGMNVYIGTSPSAMTYQGQTTSPTATFTQSTALAAGAAPPISNTTVCQVVANDAGWPTGTGYNVTISNASGNTMPGYPMQWQFLNAGSTYNLSNGLPYYDGRVTYPVPLLSQPFNHNMQSINGPLSMGTPGGIGYNIVNVNQLGVGTSLPGWGVDVEGSTLAGAINAKTGYLVNGAAGTSGECLGSDGSYFDVPVNCIIGTLPTLYYQTLDANGTAQTQRAALNFSSDFTLTDSASPARTSVALHPTGVTAGSYTCASVTFDANGRATAASTGGCAAISQSTHLGAASCSPAGTSYATCPNLLNWPQPFADTNYWVSCSLVGPVSGGAGSNALALWVSGMTTTQVTVTVQNLTSDAGTSAADISCIGVHN